MSQKRRTYKPGQADTRPESKKGPITRMIKASDVRREAEREAEEEPSEPSAPSGAGPGRALPAVSGPTDEPSPETRPSSPDSASPFVGFAPTADELAAHAASGAESSNQVLAIVAGLGFVMVSAGLAVCVISLIGWFTWSRVTGDGIADATDDKGHIRDTAVAPEIVTPKPVARPRPADGDDTDPADTDTDAGAGPVTGPIHITVPESVFFHSLEINCPDAGIRRRASFRGRTAATDGVPIREECTVTFQGSEPARTTIRGGQTKVCVSFNPTECRLQ